MSKSVTWKVSPREKLIRSSPPRKAANKNISRREQPTWDNCKKERPFAERRSKRSQSPSMISSSITASTRSRFKLINLSSLQQLPVTIEPERGREVFRRKAVSQLKVNFSSPYVKFSSSDLLEKTKVLRPQTQPHSKSYTETAQLATKEEETRNRVYMFNGVSSRAYRRPSLQFADIQVLTQPSRTRRSSEPLLISQPTEDKVRFSPESMTGYSFAPSTSAPATIASDDETSKSSGSKEDREYLKREWKSDILSRYAKTKPWIPKYRTDRYFPKYDSLQDLYCKNPYLIPNGLLYGIKN